MRQAIFLITLYLAANIAKGNTTFLSYKEDLLAKPDANIFLAKDQPEPSNLHDLHPKPHALANSLPMVNDIFELSPFIPMPKGTDPSALLTRTCSISITNRFSHRLYNPTRWIYSGAVGDIPSVIDPGQNGALTGTNEGCLSSRGTSGVVTFLIEGMSEKLSIMWTVPLDLVYHYNIVNVYLGPESASEQLYNALYTGTLGTLTKAEDTTKLLNLGSKIGLFSYVLMDSTAQASLQVPLKQTTLQSGQSLSATQGLTSLNLGSYAVMQDDGNFVVYNQRGYPTWNSKTTGIGSPPYRLSMQTDGNLVVYANNVATWNSKTTGKGTPGYYLVMQTDGNLVLYDGMNTATWSSNHGS